MGQSPFQESSLITSYRYTPILAYLLIPNQWFQYWGKILFSAFDVACGWLIFEIAKPGNNSLRIASYWLFNPAVMVISTRGSCDGVISFFVLGCLHATIKGRCFLGGALWGFAVHLRLYPIVYGLPLVLFLANRETPGTGEVNKLEFWRRVFQAKTTWIFISTGFAVFALLFLSFYKIYGSLFAEEYLWHHLSRRDEAHNFSV